MRLLARLLLPLLLVALLIPAPLSAAADASATVAFSASTLAIGDELTVTLNFLGGSVGAVDATVSYDAAVLQFVSGTDASGGGGLVQVAGWASSEVTSLRFTLKFKALKAGSSTVRIDRSTVYAWDETLLGNPTAGATVTVKDPALSQNANLKSLSLSAGRLSPAFSANTTVYTATVSNAVTSVNISAAAADSNAKVQISGNAALQVGSNKRTITVTAPGGAVKVYTVTITRSRPTTTAKPTTTTTTVPPPESQPQPLTLNGVDYTVHPLADADLPAGYTADTLAYGEMTLPVAKNADSTVTLLWLSTEEAEPTFCVFDAQNGTAVPFVPLAVSGGTFLVLDVTTGPAGLTETTREVNGTPHRVWRFPEAERADFCVIRAINAAGETGWYCWDTVENTVQRYIPAAAAAATTVTTVTTLSTTTAATAKPMPAPQVDWLPWCVAGGLLLVCIALAILAAIFHRRHSAPPPKH